jgi:hypothetical protein
LEALDRLIMAAVQYRSHETLEAYRACYEIGRPLVPQIVERIQAIDWKVLGPGERHGYFTCLMYLLHDIDESASRNLADEILGKGCHPVVAVRLRSIQAFTLKDFEAQAYGPLTIYLAKTISPGETAWSSLKTWLGHIPAEDLEGIQRLYVVERDRLPGLLGNYLRVLSVISMIWPPPGIWNRLGLLQAELTLYHEVGHHVDRRRPELRESREALADTYAERLFRKVHPRLGKRWLVPFINPAHAIRKIRRVRRLTRKPETDVLC